MEKTNKKFNDMVEMLETRKLDVIVDTLPIDSKKEVTKITLSKLNNCFAYNKNYFKNVKINSIEDLNNYPLVLPTSAYSSRVKLDEFLSSKGIKVNPVLESWTTEVLLEMVRKGIGIGYFSKEVIDSQKDKDDFEIITLILCTICNLLLFRSVKNLYDEFLRQLWSWQSYILYIQMG